MLSLHMGMMQSLVTSCHLKDQGRIIKEMCEICCLNGGICSLHSRRVPIFQLCKHVVCGRNRGAMKSKRKHFVLCGCLWSNLSTVSALKIPSGQLTARYGNPIRLFIRGCLVTPNKNGLVCGLKTYRLSWQRASK